ncbi:MAG: 16S rRNA (cytosine(967)-C(5))-methyltransferase RsmB [Chitinivibrionales bacterium]|nr:16S rRNA (cytosine(967)-C(5))-methyltransferase RsmB [Chitinivibrionales bacterium]
MNSRLVAFKILERFDRRLGKLDALISPAFSSRKIDHRDRRFIFELIYGLMRRRLTLDFYIDKFLTHPKSKNNRTLVQILQIGLYQILYMSKVPDHAAVHECVELAKNNPRTRNSSKTVNAVLRTIIRNKRNLPQPDNERLSSRLAIQFSHPEWLVERWLKRYGLAAAKSLMEFNNKPADIYIRRKRKGLSRQQFEIESRAISDPVNGYLNLYYRLKKSMLPETVALLKEGYCTVQAPSSGWATAMLDAQPGDRILDQCASPGGKTSLLAELVEKTGAVVATDICFSRARKIRHTVRRMRLENVYVVQADGCHTPVQGQFDKVLVDAPCTGTGVFHRNPEARWNKRKSDVQDLAELQSHLLEVAAGNVAHEGILVYSTCSMEPEENEEQILSFLQAHPEFVLEPPPQSIPDQFADLDGYLRISPHIHKLDGMFAARLRKFTVPAD